MSLPAGRTEESAASAHTIVKRTHGGLTVEKVFSGLGVVVLQEWISGSEDTTAKHAKAGIAVPVATCARGARAGTCAGRRRLGRRSS